MSYAPPLRYDFMVNAVAEYGRNCIVKSDLPPAPYYIGWIEVYYIMKHKESPKTRGDWFKMYNMGGEPFPHRG